MSITFMYKWEHTLKVYVWKIKYTKHEHMLVNYISLETIILQNIFVNLQVSAKIWKLISLP